MQVSTRHPNALERAVQTHAIPGDDIGLRKLISLRLAGAAFLAVMDGPDLTGRAQALMHRLENGLATRADQDLLASLPECYLAPEELVRLFAQTAPPM